jgi:ATP-dependent helicase/nuclease subunit A
MRARILLEAARLLQGAPANSGAAWVLSPTECGEAILSAAQKLKVTTIDALFMEWVQRFPFEAGHGVGAFSYPFRLCEPRDAEELNRRAWESVFSRTDAATLTSLFGALSGSETVLDSARKAQQLSSFSTMLWLTESLGTEALSQHRVSGEVFEDGWRGVIRFLAHDLRTLAQQTSRADAICEAIAQEDISALIKSKLLTADLRVSGSLLRGKKRDELADVIFSVEEALHTFGDGERLRELNFVGRALFVLFRLWREQRQVLKRESGIVEFDDLAKGVFRLFQDDANRSAVWLLQRQVSHLLLDEFQDTSALQWSIFQRLLEEMLSGTGERPSSAFIVGDVKQSIYGFREAEPRVMESARALVAQFGSPTREMSESWRTCQPVLDFINTVFTTLPTSMGVEPARTAVRDGQPVVPACGRVFVSTLIEPRNVEDKAPRAEAAFVAATLAQLLAHPERTPIYDKGTGGFRSLRASDCAILYRDGINSLELVDALTRAGVPAVRCERGGFWQRDEIVDTLALLRFVVAPPDFLALLAVLRSPICNVDDASLQQAVWATRAVPWVERPVRLLEDFFPDIAERFARWRESAEAERPHRFLRKLLRSLSLEERYENPTSASTQLGRLLALVVKAEIDGAVTLGPVVAHLVASSDLGEQSPAGETGEAVQLMTVHKAKGLEFPLVWVVETGKAWFRPDRYWRKSEAGQVSYIGVAGQRPVRDAAFLQDMQREHAQLYEESVRLLYVALTRPAQYLYVSGHASAGSEFAFLSSLQKSVQGLDGLVSDERGWMRDTSAAYSCDLPNHQESPRGGLEGNAPVESGRNSLADLTLVYPHEFVAKRAKLARTQDTLGPLAAPWGVAVHRALELAAHGEPVSVSEVWREFLEQPFSRSPGTETREALQARLHEEIQRTLVSEFWTREVLGAQKRRTEVELVHRVGSVLMRGTADLVLTREDGSLLVVDYKTSTPHGLSDDDLAEHCTDHGYFVQLGWYVRAVAALHEGAHVDGVVWLTSAARAVPLLPVAENF